MNKFLWVRCGDADDYNKFDNLGDVADYLAGGDGVGGALSRYNQLAVKSKLYKGDNHISLYWGDDDAQPIDERGGRVSNAELRELNRLLRVARAWEERK